MSHRPVCVKCQIELIPKRNDIRVVSDWGKPELEEIWCADLWGCPHCGAQVILGFGASPIISAQHPQYASVKEGCSAHGIFLCIEE